jgi:hypothetical protein
MSLKFNMFWIIAGALAAATPSHAATTGVADALVDELRTVYRTQETDGTLRFAADETFFAQAPALATLCLAATEGRQDAAFINQSASAIGRYYNSLFAAHDRDHNLLVETPLVDPNGDTIAVEDPGYNSLLALDMLSLAQLNVEIRRPYEALYWYEGSRSVQDAVLRENFDPRARYFFPFSVETGRRLPATYALSALPLLFGARVGDNHAATIIRDYFLTSTGTAPESPYDYLAGPAVREQDDVAASMRSFKSLMMIEVLQARGFEVEARAFRTPAALRARQSIDALQSAGVLSSPHDRMFAELLDGDTPFHDPLVALTVFRAIMHSVRALEDNEIVRLESNLDDLRRFSSAPSVASVAPGDLTRAQMAIRDVYRAVSTARDQVAAKQFFPSEAYRSMGGMDPIPAIAHLLDDVTTVLENAENRIFEQRNRESGLAVSARLLNETAVLGGSVGVEWTMSAKNAPVSVASASMITGDDTETLVAPDESLALQPATPVTRTARVRLDEGDIDALLPLTLTLAVDDGSDQPMRYHAHRTVFLEHPVAVSVTFPEGRMLSGQSVPIDVTMVKKSSTATTVRYEWYSPTGLALYEGRSAEYTMEAGNDSTTLRVNVLVPAPCRPGRFPFKLKFVGNGTDLGTVSSSFYRPYHWVFAGPFDAPRNAMYNTYPPEEQVNLLAEYPVGGHTVGWKILGPRAHDPQGDVSLARVMPGGTRAHVGFLYTAIESPDQATSPVFLGANATAALYVNGKLVTRVDPTSAGSPTYARIDLKRGTNDILIKLVGNPTTHVYFNIGDENDEASFGYDNNMMEIAPDYATLERRGRGHDDAEHEAQKLVTLRYRDPDAQAVAVIGSFNGWSPEQSRMTRHKDGVWEITLSLPPGKHAYRFLVNNRQQVVDPSGTAVEPDGFGGENSILYVQ